MNRRGDVGPVIVQSHMKGEGLSTYGGLRAAFHIVSDEKISCSSYCLGHIRFTFLISSIHLHQWNRKGLLQVVQLHDYKVPTCIDFPFYILISKAPTISTDTHLQGLSVTGEGVREPMFVAFKPPSPPKRDILITYCQWSHQASCCTSLFSLHILLYFLPLLPCLCMGSDQHLCFCFTTTFLSP